MNKTYFNYDLFIKCIVEKRWQDANTEKQNQGLRHLASKIGTTAATLSRILNGRPIDLETAIKTCLWLNKSVDFFVQYPKVLRSKKGKKK